MRNMSSITMDQAASRYRQGHMTALEWRWYSLIWKWAAPRFSGPAGAAQGRYYAKLGFVALERRQERIRRLGEAKGIPASKSEERR